MSLDRPILFSAEMVRAILDGRKTQTRRVVKPQPIVSENGWAKWGWADVPGPKGLRPKRSMWHADTWQRKAGTAPLEEACPYGQPGDRLWVRETFSPFGDRGAFFYKADVDQPDDDRPWMHDQPEPFGGKWKPSIHMPREACRLTLEITGVRVERVQAISEQDAQAEGVERDHGPWKDYKLRTLNGCATARDSFASLWDHINAARAPWASNPWVWVVSFAQVAP